MSKRILIAIAVLLLAGGFYASFRSHQQTSKQVSAILAADKAGQDTVGAIALLKDFVAAHMGSGTNFTLSGSYQRAQEAARASVQSQSANSQIYAQAAQACAGKSDSITQAKCNQDYLSKHLAAVTPPSPVAEPKAADYQYHLKSPLWTADLAGALFLGAAAALILLAFNMWKNRS